ncbi:MAG: putative Ig domain-containing protein, partial [Deltaproteobacteria bacterium]|nr:Ig domain-containing protein [Candidatus Deferrimicrobiaceae bacterium]
EREPPADAAKPDSSMVKGNGLRIHPEEVHRGTSVRLSFPPSLPAGATIEWLVNGKAAQGSGDAAIETSSLRKGDSIQARAVGAGGTYLSQVVTVRNSPPEVRAIRFVLGDGRQGSVLGVEAEGYDADGDPVRLEISWQKNGAPAGTGNRMETPVKRGDKVGVTIVPFDEEGRGKAATLSRDITNTPPVIEGQEQFQVRDDGVTFHVRASDADGDTLAYSIKDAPAGMHIDRATGWVRWKTPPGTPGRVPFTVTVSDGSGGEATARFTVTVTEQPPVPSR